MKTEGEKNEIYLNGLGKKQKEVAYLNKFPSRKSSFFFTKIDELLQKSKTFSVTDKESSQHTASIIGRSIHIMTYKNETNRASSLKRLFNFFTPKINFLSKNKNSTKKSNPDDESLIEDDFSEITTNSVPYLYNEIDTIEFLKYQQTGGRLENDNTKSVNSLLVRLSSIVAQGYIRVRNNRVVRKILRLSKFGHHSKNRNKKNNRHGNYGHKNPVADGRPEFKEKDMVLLQTISQHNNSRSFYVGDDSVASENKARDKSRYQRKRNSTQRNLVNRRASF